MGIFKKRRENRREPKRRGIRLDRAVFLVSDLQHVAVVGGKDLKVILVLDLPDLVVAGEGNEIFQPILFFYLQPI